MLEKHQKYAMLFVTIVVGILFYPIAICRGNDGIPSPQHTWGLCIGISRYSYSPEIRNLEWANKDAIGFCELFLEYELGVSDDQYSILQENNATRENIMTQLDWLRRKAKKDDRVYIFYSGHGEKKFPILPYDAAPTEIEEYDTNPDATETLLSKNNIIEALAKIEAQEIIFIHDACYSGVLAGKGEVIGSKQEPFSEWLSKEIFKEKGNKAETKIVRMTSSTGTQISRVLKEKKNSIFTQYLLDTLIKHPWKADVDPADEKLTIYEVYREVYNAVTNGTARFKISQDSLNKLKSDGVPYYVRELLERMKYEEVYEQKRFLELLKIKLGEKYTNRYRALILKHTLTLIQQPQISDKETARQIVLFSKPTPLPTPTPAYTPTPTPIPTITDTPTLDDDEFNVIVQDVNGKILTSVEDDTYVIRKGEAVTITVDFTNPYNHNIVVTLTAEKVKVQQISPKVAVYRAEKLGEDSIMIYVWDQETGKELQKYIIMTVIP